MKNFLHYYQDELLFLRKSGGAFAKNHPDIADKLDIKNGESTDPHTERIIESVAFMSAKLNQRIDDNAQTIAFHLLAALYPNLINVFPPCSIVKFESDESVFFTDNIVVKRGTSIYGKSKSDIECLFKTVYPLSIYPISISEIKLLKTNRRLGGVDGWCIEIKIISNTIPIEEIGIKDLLFHINSEIIEDSLLLYESIFFDPDRSVFLKINDTYIKVDNKNVVPCGFNNEDTVCPVPKYSNNSFQLFQEMLFFKNKFMFFRVLGLDELINSAGITEIREIALVIDINFSDDNLNRVVKNDSIILNATPIVNLFQITSDPFRFDGTQTRYLLFADQIRDKSVEIHSISEVHIIDNTTKEDSVVQPYFSLSIDTDTNITHHLYWTYSRESADIRGLSGFDTYLSFIDTKMNPHAVYADVVYAKTLCTNRFETRDIPVFSRMYVDSLETANYSATLLHKTTKPVSFTEDTTTLWNLVSQLSSTHISIAKSENLLQSIEKLVSIFSAGNKIKMEELLNDIKDIKTREVVHRFGKDAWRGFVKGIEVSIYVGEDNGTFFSYFFCAILNQYLSSSISINSLVELKLISSDSGKTLARWHPTSGRKELI